MNTSMMGKIKRGIAACGVAVSLAGFQNANAQGTTFTDNADNANFVTFFAGSSTLYVDTNNLSGGDTGAFADGGYDPGNPDTWSASGAYDAQAAGIFGGSAKFSHVVVHVQTYAGGYAFNGLLQLGYQDGSDINGTYKSIPGKVVQTANTGNWTGLDYTFDIPASRFVKFTLAQDPNFDYPSAQVGRVTLTQASSTPSLFRDDFDTTANFLPPFGTGNTWRYDVPGDTTNTLIPADIAVSGGKLNITHRGGSLGGSDAHNAVNLKPKSVPADWYVQTVYSVNYPANATNYPSGGMGIFYDRNNFAILQAKLAPGNYDYFEFAYSLNGAFHGDALPVYGGAIGLPSGNQATLNIAKDSASGNILVAFQSGTSPNFTGPSITLTPTETDNDRKNIYMLLNNVATGRVGLVQQNAGGGQNVYAYDYFQTNIVPQTDFVDNFDTAANFLPPFGTGSTWHFDIPGEGDTYNAADINVSGGKLNVKHEMGAVNGGTAQNAANLKVTDAAPADWYIETRYSLDWSTSTDGYPSGGFGVIADTGNFVLFQLKKQPFSNYEYAELVYAKNGSYHDDAIVRYLAGFGTIGTNGQVTLRLAKDPLTSSITASYISAPGSTDGASYHIFDTLTPTETNADRANIYALLNGIGTSRPALFQQNTGNPKVTYSYDYFATNLTVTPTGNTVTGTLALDGVGDLTAVNPAVPVGNITFDFFNANSATHTTPLFTKTAALTPVGSGSPNGTFTLSGVTAGSYDIAIHSSESLRTVVKNVNANSNVTLPGVTTLLGGNANGDNTVNFDDFLILLNAFGSKASDPLSGFDPAADFNYSGIVDFDDFLILLNNFGSVGDI